MRRPAAKDKLGDAELLRLSGKGDEEAFLILYRRHQAPVFRFALHMSGKIETAEEVTQEVFLSLLSEASRYANERGTLQGYLIGAARNQVRRQLRDARKTILEGIEFGSNSGEYLLEELGREQELAALREAILKLTNEVPRNRCALRFGRDGVRTRRGAVRLRTRNRSFAFASGAENFANKAAKAGKMPGINDSFDLQEKLNRMAKLLPTDASARAEAQVLMAFRTRRRKRRMWRYGASLAVLLALVSGWFWARHSGQATQTDVAHESYAGAIAGFVALPYSESDVPMEDAVIVRVRLHASELGRFGVPVGPGTADGKVADLLVGQDGVARAVRLVE